MDSDLTFSNIAIGVENVGTFVGFNVSIDNPKYERNRFIFNFFLVLEEYNTFKYEIITKAEIIVRRTCEYFSQFEFNHNYLSSDIHISDLYYYLKCIVNGLNVFGECFVRVDTYLHINLKYITFQSKQVDKYRKSDVPILSPKLYFARNGTFRDFETNCFKFCDEVLNLDSLSFKIIKLVDGHNNLEAIRAKTYYMTHSFYLGVNELVRKKFIKIFTRVDFRKVLVINSNIKTKFYNQKAMIEFGRYVSKGGLFIPDMHTFCTIISYFDGMNNIHQVRKMLTLNYSYKYNIKKLVDYLKFKNLVTQRL
ncbi:hypothetical protein A3Q56_06245 [Intoshia linei]|uniref:Uncharacterized protein n=1 Tax=Intoshia linei TaxID=1819745 RepID=A0A177AX05_9BILA|nr:hypothetical protein A3Q56_06245 [Intoshia linei]